MKRQKLKELRQKGIKGYSEGDKLITLDSQDKGHIKSRVFKRAVRQSELRRSTTDVNNEYMDTQNAADYVSQNNPVHSA